ncbi:hypothetical protein ACFXTH_041785 [Malus domestica]
MSAEEQKNLLQQFIKHQRCNLILDCSEQEAQDSEENHESGEDAPTSEENSDSGESAPTSEETSRSSEVAPTSKENTDFDEDPMSVIGSNEVEGTIYGNISDSGEAAPISGEMSMTEAPISAKISGSEQEYRPISPKMSDPWKQEEIPNCDDYVPWLIDNTEFVQELVEELMIGDPPLLDYSNENPSRNKVAWNALVAPRISKRTLILSRFTSTITE